MSALEESAISSDYKFGADDGFFVAAALTAYDLNEEITEEERYGELVIEHYGWGYDGNYIEKSVNIENHFCSEEELGLKIGGSGSILYETVEANKIDVIRYRKKFKCVAREDSVIWGNYNSEKT